LGHFFVLISAISRFTFSIDRENNSGDILFAIVRSGLGHSRWMAPGRPEIFRHRALQFVIAVVGVAAARLFRMRVDVNCPDLRDIDHVNSSQAHDRGVVVIIEPFQKFLAQRQHLASVDTAFCR
jgi:hypothetical protein